MKLNHLSSLEKINEPIHVHPLIYINNQQALEVDYHKHLTLFLSNDGSWHHQINFMLEIAWCRIYTMRKLKFKLDRKSLKIINTAFIRPIIEYGDDVAQ